MLIELVLRVDYGVLVVVEKGKKSLVDNRKHKLRTLYFKNSIILTYHGVKRILDIGSTRGNYVAVTCCIDCLIESAQATKVWNYWLLWIQKHLKESKSTRYWNTKQR